MPDWFRHPWFGAFARSFLIYTMLDNLETWTSLATGCIL